MPETGSETVLAFDIGGTWFRLAEVAPDGKFLWESRESPAHDYPRDLEILRRMVDARSKNVVAVAFACPGPLDFRTGEVLRAANVNWYGVFPGKDLEAYLNVPVVVENDADCAALGEAVYGEARGSMLLVYYGLGTGLGSGVVEGGAIFHGSFDPEFGHQLVEPSSDRVCTSGHHGCLEALVSGGGLERAFGSIANVPEEQWRNVIPDYLGRALTNATLFFSPDAIVVGGGVVDHRPDIVEPAIHAMNDLLAGFVDPPRVLRSSLGREVGLLGAAAAAWGHWSRQARAE